MREPAKALNDIRVKNAKPPAAGQIDIPDGVLPGFALRVTAKGHKSYVLFYRPKAGPNRGKLQRLTIGTAAELTLAKARKMAGEFKDMVAAGKDPKAHLEGLLAAEDARQRNTVEAALADFVERYAKRQTKSWQETEATFRRHVLPRWKDRPLTDITRRDLLDLLDELVDEGKPIAANRVLAHVRKAFNWFIERGMLETSPADRVKPPAREEARERVLADEEIADLWPTFEGLGYPFGAYCKVLLLLGQRRDEVAGMRWADVDLDKAEWTLPRKLTKSNRAHLVPLPPLAVDILKALPRFDAKPGDEAAGKAGIYVFTTTEGRAAISGYSKVKERIETAVAGRRTEQGREAMPQWQFHDFRRTVGTRLTEMGFPLDHVGRVLNHAKQGVTGTVYDQHTYLPEKRRALEAWSAKVQEITAPTRTPAKAAKAAKAGRKASNAAAPSRAPHPAKVANAC